MNLHTRGVYNHTEYDVTNYFRSEATAKKTVANSASDGFMWNSSRKVYAMITRFHAVVGADWPHESVGYDAASCSGRLQNATKYWTKLMRKTGLAG